MPFSDPIVAGTTLIRRAIQSVDYVAGVSGWIIERNGDAEFNDAVFRGTIEASTMISDDPVADERVKITEGEVSLRKKSDDSVIATLRPSDPASTAVLETDIAQLVLPTGDTVAGTLTLSASDADSMLIEALNAGGLAGIDINCDLELNLTTGSSGRISAQTLSLKRHRIYRGAAQSIPNNTSTTVVFNTVHGTGNAGTLNTGTGVFTITEEGLYLVGATVVFAGNGTGRREMNINHSGSIIGNDDDSPAGTTADRALSAVALNLFSVNDTIDVDVFQNSGAALNINGGAYVGNNSRFWIVRLGTQNLL